jgi:FkbM family methyltransferase
LSAKFSATASDSDIPNSTQELQNWKIGMTNRFAKARKALALLTRRKFAAAVMRHRVAAAVEHLDAIAFTGANVLIDVGANKGQFSLAFRALRPNAQIVAFEPLGEEADTYQRVFAGDAKVVLHRTALSDHVGEAEFHVTDRADSSSLLKPGVRQAEAFGVNEQRLIRIPLDRLDNYLPELHQIAPVLLKIDVQGAELQVLKGCASLDAIDYIYVELSFVELYERQPLLDEVFEYLRGRGFRLVGVFNQAMTSYGPTQADCLFKRGA